LRLAGTVTLNKRFGVPAERIEILRNAFDMTMKDPSFVEDATKEGMDIEPISGIETQSLVKASCNRRQGQRALFGSSSPTNGIQTALSDFESIIASDASGSARYPPSASRLDRHGCAKLHSVVEVQNVSVMHANAAIRNHSAD
jgi:hypothetical protein